MSEWGEVRTRDSQNPGWARHGMAGGEEGSDVVRNRASHIMVSERGVGSEARTWSIVAKGLRE